MRNGCQQELQSKWTKEVECDSQAALGHSMFKNFQARHGGIHSAITKAKARGSLKSTKIRSA